MKIFSIHRKKLEARRRFGGLEFRSKVKSAGNYKRIFDPAKPWARYKFWRNVGIGLLVIIIYFFTISTELLISDVKVTGNETISSQQIQDVLAFDGNSRLFFVKKSNYFLMTEGRVNKLLTQSLPNIRRAVSKRIWPNKIEIAVTERTAGFALMSNGKYYLVDDEGTVVSPIDSPEKLLVVEDQVVEDFASGEALPNTKLAPFVISMAKQWPSKVSSPIISVKFPGKGSNDVQFDTAEDWRVLFDINRSVVSQLGNLAVILNKQLTAADRGNLAYIDLRLSKWAYICFKASPCQQQEQDSGNTNDDVTPE